MQCNRIHTMAKCIFCPGIDSDYPQETETNGNTLKRGGGNGATLAHCLFTFGTSYDICCAYYSSFSHRGNTTFNEEMFAHSLYCSYYKERENVYCKIISEYIYCWK